MRSAYLTLTTDTAEEAERIYAPLSDGGQMFSSSSAGSATACGKPGPASEHRIAEEVVAHCKIWVLIRGLRFLPPRPMISGPSQRRRSAEHRRGSTK
jgi:hypothetical protein